jgi:hypothetical protein
MALYSKIAEAPFSLLAHGEKSKTAFFVSRTD